MPGDAAFAPVAVDRDETFPVRLSRAKPAKLLVVELRSHVQPEGERRDAQFPPDRIESVALGRAPIGRGAHGTIDIPNRDGGAVGADEHAGRERIDQAVGVSQSLEHELSPVVDLEREPIPAGNEGVHAAPEELVIAPSRPMRRAFAAAALDPAGCIQAREGDVVG